jgi:hypothetical protein
VLLAVSMPLIPYNILIRWSNSYGFFMEVANHHDFFMPKPADLNAKGRQGRAMFRTRVVALLA